MAPKANLFTRDVESIDQSQRIVRLSPGTRQAATSIHYDHLVIAMGTRLDHSKIPGMREHAQIQFSKRRRRSIALSCSISRRSGATGVT